MPSRINAEDIEDGRHDSQDPEASANLQRAERFAKELLKSGAKKPTEQQVTDALLQIGKVWPTQQRPNVADKPAPGFSMGLTYGLGGKGMKVSKTSEVCPELTKLLVSYVKSTIPDKDFQFSSLQVNYCYTYMVMARI